MMRISLVFFGIILTSFLANTFDAQIRDLYLKALKSDKEIAMFKKKSEAAIKHPLGRAYYGTALALEARASSWVGTKVELAKKASQNLNAAVSQSSQDFEIRFLRFSFEHNVPSMLGLSGHVADDKEFLLNFKGTKPPIKTVISGFLSKCDDISETEKAKILKGL
ncbi:MAG: hypothetical protein NBV77_05410 [Bacteroidia bacterium]|nr:hypothetical protein [Bacteroidia bacterium]